MEIIRIINYDGRVTVTPMDGDIGLVGLHAPLNSQEMALARHHTRTGFLTFVVMNG